MQFLSMFLFLVGAPIVSAFTFFPTGAGISSHSSSSSNSMMLFSVTDLKADLKLNPTGTYLLDVREAAQWAEGHLASASPNPLSQLKTGKWMDNATGKFAPGSFPIDRLTGVGIMMNRKIYVHGEEGGTAKEATELLGRMGYKDVTALEETFDQLAAAEICDVVMGEVQDLTDG
ncbi:unnamed protein product [Cylindrotheca closterium]|uniref:Rhodanese domain-containing protein n=1 Tax=Cylindrotheca closterium TaxID=2856 RepID=A0AAD2G1Z7_9STRA|nr:unnamed protein product [Cylindrotheca closterium]